ncbi:phosphoribosyltransferase [Actinacidiphila bryophytorum]|uniref:Adenine phosphoribosyltransferase/orotate phosphoribosyltransferase n=1 Tax=Actinacidiphila bryophytorum TaxID=1436133 RepID=A0A9W4H1N3_9ACTN|nr:phosphoribosyltransferase [Actinacidiphila bryophytorum]MBM9435159.1 phosphoribosyltransferase [Actinacidiphila bryophytorum]MBN6541540.1 phosphoribosyltransferase [Actinacidiphila bryophytorum]CAG7643471.1 Adenine phosphoribosyltransferase/orotate phosphoribosyltransferase [Actinacidiphila bryophytorum]
MPETVAVPPFSARVVERLGVDLTSRTERVIHSLDGLEEPVHPDTLTEAGSQLWNRLLAEVPELMGNIDFLLGLDAGGILPTVSLASASAVPYKIAWKLELPLDGAVRFSEPHAVRTDVFAYGIAPGQRIVLVDDEVTTGRTLADLTVRLREAGARPLAAACLVEDVTQGARELLSRLRMPLVALADLEPAR